MRDTGFLRTPIKASHETRFRNLQVSEQPLTGNPGAADVYPQTLIVSFEVIEGNTEIEIAPLWEGSLYFIADDTTGYPNTPEEVLPTNFDKWNLVGDLVLHSSTGFMGPSSVEAAFASHIKLINPVPLAVRYSKVRLTRDFLFTTLSTMPKVRLLHSATPVEVNDPKWHGKFVVGFLRGRTHINCTVDPVDPSKDFANRKMPSVHFASAGSATTLNVLIASRAPEVELGGGAFFFIHNPLYDDISGEPLVPPGLESLHHQRFNPAHPGHSVISAFALYQSAGDVAYAPDFDAAKPLRSALTAPRSDGAVYRRIDLIRPPAPGNAVTTSFPQRPYPQYQLAWRPTAGGATRSVRIPISGRLYLPLTDQAYTFWAIPRSQDPNVIVAGTQLQLSRKQPPKKYIDLPSATVSYMPGSGNDPEPLYAHLLEYDGKIVWALLLGTNEADHKSKAKATWNVTVLNLFILRFTAMAPYARIYGHIRAAAGRHGFAPEFMHAVFMGEGVGASDNPATPLVIEDGLIEQHRKAGVPYNDNEQISGFDWLGLDVIQDSAPVLVANNYLDPTIAARITNLRTIPNELGQMVRTADVVGWEAATEMVAAELHSRLDEMLAYCVGKGIAVTTEEQRRFLAYIRFNVSAPTAKNHADHLNQRLRPWVGPEPPDQMDEHFNTLQRLAIAEWYERAQVYR